MIVFIRMISIAGLLLAAVGLAFVGGYVGWFLSGCIGFICLYMIVISICMRGDIVAERMIHQRWLEAGDEVEVTVTLHLPSRYWLCWIMVEERWVRKAREEEERYACSAFIRGSRRMTCRYKTSGKLRGLYRVNSSCVIIGDVFGLVKRSLAQEEHDGEIVQVRPRPLPGSWLNSVQHRGDITHGFGTLRDYMNGDPITSIDWKSYARYQKLKTKQREAEEGRSILIVLDAQRGSIANFETIVSMAARMVLEMNDHSLDLTLACGESRCEVIYCRQSGLSSSTYDWLTSLEADTLDSFPLQMRKAINLAGFCGQVIGITSASDRNMNDGNRGYMEQPFIQFVYVSPNGVINYA
jgi:uncharacterized protein (DUF58 family)